LQGLNVGHLDTADGNHGRSGAFRDRSYEFQTPRPFGGMCRCLENVARYDPIALSPRGGVHTLPNEQPGRDAPHVRHAERSLPDLHSTRPRDQCHVDAIIDDKQCTGTRSVRCQ
jgi:hypothetical protein